MSTHYAWQCARTTSPDPEPSVYRSVRHQRRYTAGLQTTNPKGPPMIQLYTWPTPNGHKVQIMLEEVGVPYTVHPIDIIRGAQFDPDYLALNPNNKVPT